jgi:hypothetical protein
MFQHRTGSPIVADVTVSFAGYTNQNSDRRMLFVISNAGPRAIEFDIGHLRGRSADGDKSDESIC